MSLEIKAAVVSDHSDKEQQELLYELLVYEDYYRSRKDRGVLV